MLNDAFDEFDLPPNPDDLTRELALKCCTFPEVLVEKFAHLSHTQLQPTPSPSPVLEKVASNG